MSQPGHEIRVTRGAALLTLVVGLAAVVASCVSASAAPIRVSEQQTVEGVLRTIESGWITLDDQQGRRRQYQIQAKNSAGIFLHRRGVVVDYPCDVKIRGQMRAGKLARGAVVQLRVPIDRERLTCQRPVGQLQMVATAGAMLRLHWPSALYLDCEIVGRVVSASASELLLEVGEARPLRVPVAPQATVELRTDDPRWLRLGDHVRVSAVRFEGGTWAVRKLEATLSELPARAPSPLLPKRWQGSVAPREVRSRFMLLRTDLPPAAARELIASVDRMCEMLGRHFGRTPDLPVRCVVVSEISRWSRAEFEETAWAKLKEQAGVTITERVGGRFTSKVYAVAKPKVVLHEMVHAFCGQAFGDTGPTWYAEGIAELGGNWDGSPDGIAIDPVVSDYVRASRPKSLGRIATEQQGTGDSWQAYAWRWAACSLLAGNPNYSQRFSRYGRQLMTQSDDEARFEQFWGEDAQRAEFEFQQFLRHMGCGYNHQLCAWDWNAKFEPFDVRRRTVECRVLARRGWQPSGVQVRAGESYAFQAAGSWKVDAYRGPVSANGWPRGEGQLCAIVLDENMQLSAPFRMGAGGAFQSPYTGRMYLRCLDKWTQLDDNAGELEVRITRLAPPTRPSSVSAPNEPNQRSEKRSPRASRN